MCFEVLLCCGARLIDVQALRVYMEISSVAVNDEDHIIARGLQAAHLQLRSSTCALPYIEPVGIRPNTRMLIRQHVRYGKWAEDDGRYVDYIQTACSRIFCVCDMQKAM